MSSPWGYDDACNRALGHLVHKFRVWLTREGRIHAETYLAASGAIAGFAAQRALMAKLAKAPDPAALRGLHIVSTASGERFLFGDPLNDTLVAKGEADAGEKLFSLAAGGAVAAGLAQDRLPPQGEIFGHVAKVLGGAEEGWPSVDPRHRPAMPVKPLLASVWPLAASIFSGRNGDHGVVPQRWRPAIAATATNVHIRDVTSVLHPLIAYTIVVESAVYASKLDAGRIVPTVH